MIGLDSRHWTVKYFSQRMKKSDWHKVLLDYDEKVIFKGKPTKLAAKDIGNGVVEVSKDIKGDVVSMENIKDFAKKCKHKSKPKAYFVDKAEKNEWISVEDRLPESHIDVLIYDGKEIITGRISWVKTDVNEYMNVLSSNGYVHIEGATHWMPLPKPPE